MYGLFSATLANTSLPNHGNPVVPAAIQVSRPLLSRLLELVGHWIQTESLGDSKTRSQLIPLAHCRN